MDNRYLRQLNFNSIGEHGQAAIGQGRVAVLGVGALGTVIASTLARSGVGFIRLIDRDFVETSNLQRQMLYDEGDVELGLPKTVAAAKHLKGINSSIIIEGLAMDMNASNIISIINDVDIVLDGTDNLETRLLINDACCKQGKPWIYGAAVASYGITMNILPGKTPCLRCLYKTIPPPGVLETCSSAGVLGMITGIIGNIQATEAIKLLVSSPSLRAGVCFVDVWNTSFEQIILPIDECCPSCAQHIYEYLDAAKGTYTVSMCGRDAVQVFPAYKGDVDFSIVADKLKGLGKVKYNEYILRFTAGKLELTLFSDGRAIIKGVKTADSAKSVYAEYIGL